jgi:hypothetical protein
MEQNQTAQDLLNPEEHIKPALPSGLNVLTILTFIGCGLLGLLTLLMPMLYDFFLKLMDKATESGQELSAKQLADMEKGRQAIELAKQNVIPIMAIGMVGIILCFVGALWMRKLKKDGFWMYVAGQVAPLLGSVFIMGTAQYNSISNIALGIAIPLVFILLYATQRKYLVK